MSGLPPDKFLAGCQEWGLLLLGYIVLFSAVLGCIVAREIQRLRSPERQRWWSERISQVVAAVKDGMTKTYDRLVEMVEQSLVIVKVWQNPAACALPFSVI